MFSDSNLQNADANAINDSGVFVGGYCLTVDEFMPFAYPPFQALVGPGLYSDSCPGVTGNEFEASDINNAGTLIGSYRVGYSNYNNCGPLHGFVYAHGTYSDVPAPGSDQTVQTQALGINDEGWVVGNAARTVGPLPSNAILYVDGVSYDLNSRLVGAGCEAWTLTSAVDINANNVIVGTGYIGGVEHGFMLLPQS